MGLNLSNRQIARELDLNKDNVQQMTTQLRERIVQHKAPVRLEGEVECDEVYLTAGHKGHSEAVKKTPLRTTQSTPRPTRTWYLSTGKSADLGDDPTARGGIDSDAVKCPAANY